MFSTAAITGPSGMSIDFRYPDGGHMRSHLQEILGGRAYPTPATRHGYVPTVIVDIGANIGAAAIWFWSRAPKARIVCFEPSAENFAYLTSNMASCPTAELFPWGLFNREGGATMHLGAEQCMQNSIVRSVETGAKTEAITLRRASSEFDRLGLDRVSILKLDTEGCEVPILEDLGARLEAIDQIHVEYHSEEDRRAIDAMLSRRFMLAHARATQIHRGVLLYVAHTLAESDPFHAAMRLARPQ